MKIKILKNERVIWIGIIFLLIILHCSTLGTSSNEEKERLYFSLIKETLTYIRAYYVDETKVDYKKLMHGAVKGMLESLEDDHTAFLSEKKLKELQNYTNGSFAGLGITISTKDGYPTVIAPIEGSPAFKMGIKAGDKIVEIEGKSSKDMNIDEVVKRLKGAQGSKVSIKIAREGALELVPLTITRAIIKVPSVKYGFINEKKKKNRIGYVRIISFSKKTSLDMKKALLELKAKGMKKLVLDLRNNPGGLLTASVEISDMFLNAGRIVSTRGKYKKEEEVFKSNPKNTLVGNNIPIVVLINEGSASASEILAGALKDTGRALIVGSKSYGKGSVQNIIPLRRSNERIAMRLTIQKYYTPKGISIHGKGIEPDLLINLPKKGFEELYMEKKMADGEYIKQFIAKNPNYNKKQINQLLHKLKEKGITINRRIVEKKLRDGKKQIGIPLYDLEYDVQLKKAVEVIDSPKLLPKMVKVFN